MPERLQYRRATAVEEREGERRYRPVSDRFFDDEDDPTEEYREAREALAVLLRSEGWAVVTRSLKKRRKAITARMMRETRMAAHPTLSAALQAEYRVVDLLIENPVDYLFEPFVAEEGQS